MSDLIKGYKWFCALDEETCLECLLKDGKFVKENTPPFHDRCRCVVVPVLKTFKKLGFKINEFSGEMRASAIGRVPENGGLYKHYLIERAKTKKSGNVSDIKLIEILEDAFKKYPNEIETYRKLKNTLLLASNTELDRGTIVEMIKSVTWPSPELEELMFRAYDIGCENEVKTKLQEIEIFIKRISPTYADRHISQIYSSIAKMIKKKSLSGSLFYYKRAFELNGTAGNGLNLLRIYKKLKMNSEYIKFLDLLIRLFPENNMIKKEKGT